MAVVFHADRGRALPARSRQRCHRCAQKQISAGVTSGKFLGRKPATFTATILFLDYDCLYVQPGCWGWPRLPTVFGMADEFRPDPDPADGDLVAADGALERSLRQRRSS